MAEKPLYTDLDAEDTDGVTEIESLCLNCHEQGVTRLMLTRIPFFKEVIVSSFQCEECGYSDRDVQPGSKLQDKGIRFELTVGKQRDLNRQVVKSEYAVFSIPDLEFEQPSNKKGEINTVEGLIDGVIRGLKQEQPVRRALSPDTAEKIDQFISRLEKLKDIQEPFKIVLDDPSGNSYIENPLAPQRDEAVNVTIYERTHAQEVQIGMKADEETVAESDAADSGGNAADEGNSSAAEPGGSANGKENSQNNEMGSKEKSENLNDEVMSFPANCPECYTPCQTNMKLVDIPHFKQVVIMAMNCDSCGYRENEVKSGSGIEEKGKRITLDVRNQIDMNRDVLKSDTCGLRVPEIELELVEGTLGGRFTTVEGLLQEVKEELKTKNPFFMGDGAADDTKEQLEKFFVKLEKIITREIPEFTLIVDDPAGNSHIQNVCAPDPDPQLTIEYYTRTADDDDTLGILHMKTENYAQDS